MELQMNKSITKILNYSVVAIFVLVLIGGSIFILARPENSLAAKQTFIHDEGRGPGHSNARTGTEIQRQGQQNEALDSRNGAGEGLGQSNESRYSEDSVMALETISGPVTESGNELLVNTTTGEVLVGLGPEFYREEAGFTVAVGDQVSVMGYFEDGEFKAATVENSTSDTSIVLREASGRPMWSGRGNQQNRP